MAEAVDNRIVKMEFDNKKFESGVSESLTSLDKLKKGLNLDASAKSLNNLEKAGRSFSLASIAQGVDTLASKFSALGIMGVTALQNITNRAVNAGMRIASALTIDPVKAGFQEYETQINAVQTILANTQSKGKTLEDVNAALDELNKYADKTIYNFTEMTRNIGTFTAAGVDLDTSVQAIKGIANLAAVSGSTSQQASTAMYQLSQALASGTVKLMDWNSVVNAGMGGQVFQDSLKETARVHGIAIDDLIKQEGSFRETLQHGWLTSEILTETLSKFTGDLNAEQLKTMGYTEDQIAEIIKLGQTANDAATKVKTFSQLFDTLKEAAQSGWTQSWEIIVGDFEEAKELLTQVSDVFGGIIGSSAEARNAVLQGWKDLGGRTAIIESVRNAFTGIMDVINVFKDAMDDIFPPITAQQLYDLSNSIKELTAKFKMGEQTAENLKRTFKGFFAVLDIGVQLFSAVAKGIVTLVGYIIPLGDGILDVTGNLGDAIVKFRDFIKESDIFNKVVGGITHVLGTIINAIKGFVQGVSDSINELGDIDIGGVDTFTDNVKIKFEPLTVLGKAVSAIFKGIGTIVKSVAPVAISLASLLAKGISKVITSISDAVANADFNTILDLINGGLFVGLISGIKKLIGGFDDIKESATGFLDNITGILDGVKDSLTAWQQSLKVKTITQIAIAIGILSASLVVLSSIDSAKLAGALGAVTVMFAELFGSMSLFSKLLSTNGFGAMGKITVGMIGLSTSVLILSSAMKKMAELDWEGLIKGLVGIGAVMAELAIFMKLADFGGMGAAKSVGLISLAIAVNILASAVSKFSELDLSGALKGLLVMGIVLAEISAFMNATSNAKHVISTAVSMTLLSAAMLIFASAVEKMGALPITQLAKGLGAMAVSLGIVIGALHLMPKNILGQSVSMIAMASALVILSNALSNMGNMSWEGIGKSMAALAGSLTILTVAMHAMKSALPGASAMLIVAPALAILGSVLKDLGEMSLLEIGKSLLALAGAFTVLGVASLVLKPLVPTLLGLGAAVLMLGAGFLAAGVGITAFATGLSALAVAGTAGAASIVVVVTSLISLIPALITKIGEGLIGIVKVIADSATELTGAVVKIGGALIDALIILTPKLVEAIGTVLITLLDFLSESVPKMVESGLNLLVGILKGISDNIGRVIIAAAEIVAAFIKGIGDGVSLIIDAGVNTILNFILGIANNIQKILDTATLIITEFIRGIGECAELIIEAGANLIINFISGIAKNITKVFIEASNIIIEFIRGISNGILNVVNAGVNLIVNFINGMATAIRDNTDKMTAAVDNLMNAIFYAIGKWATNWISVGKNIVDGLIEGVLSNAGGFINAIIDLARSAWDSILDFFGINSPAKEGIWAGEMIDKGLALGILSYSKDVTNASGELGDSTIASLTKSLSPISDVIDSNIEAQPTITPVIDLTNVKKGVGQIDGYFAQSKGINVSSIVGKTNAIASKQSSSNSTNNEISGQGVVQQSFTQNIYSPKAVDKTTVYRQTKNLFSTLKAKG